MQENTTETDIRCKQRFENYGKSLALLSDVVSSRDSIRYAFNQVLLGG